MKRENTHNVPPVRLHTPALRCRERRTSAQSPPTLTYCQVQPLWDDIITADNRGSERSRHTTVHCVKNSVDCIVYILFM